MATNLFLNFSLRQASGVSGRVLGIERPKLRNGQAIANQNTLIYMLINLRALQHLRQHKVELRNRGDLPASTA